ncbi:MAG TPA: rhodanese-like domain-containing protein [Anaeromyxobacteraceae bacterium]|nr:rhodanese-like domain-containing protein [Anaeromyxobacteraceae bacterium]
MPIRSLTPAEAQALLASGEIDLVDVREPHEWAGGHIEGARHVPLAELARDPRRHAPRDGVAFVCAHGLRSLTAASIASSIGRERVYSVEGGTVAWAGAGLPLVRD